ncbi:MAG: ABC-2 family transporter protein [Candidatus Dojkabacteria bacterium]
MKKYLYLIKINFSQIGAYRSDMLFGWFARLFQLFIVFALWSITQKTDQEMQKLFIYFFLFYLIFDIFCTGRISRQISKDIRRGELNSYLLKPFNYIFSVWVKIGITTIARIIVPIILFIVLAFIRPDFAAPASLVHLILFFISSIFCIILWNLFVTIIGSLSFWVNEISQLQKVISLMLSVMIGKYIPLYLFPKQLQDIISLTPVNYLGNFQILIYQGGISSQDISKGMFILITWTIIFFFIAKFTYNKGLNIYEASGN